MNTNDSSASHEPFSQIPTAVDWSIPDQTLLHDGKPHVPTLPADVFPREIHEWVELAAEGAASSPSYVASGLLAAIGGIAGAGVMVNPHGGWQEPLIVWTALVGNPSDGKTPALSVCRKVLSGAETHIRKGDVERRRDHEERFVAAKVEARCWEENVEKAVRDGQTPPNKPATADIPPKFVPRQIIIGDSTIEAIADVLTGNRQGIVQWRDELSGWLGNMSRYSGGSDRPHWLEAWAAGSTTINRKSQEPVTIDHLAVSVVGTIQPDRLAEVLAGSDDGLASRFLYVWPQRPDHIPLTQRRSPNSDLVARHLIKIAELVRSKASPLELKFAAAGVKLFEQFDREHNEWAGERHGLEGGIWGKGCGYVARLAGILALLDWACTEDVVGPPDIGADTVGRAISLWRDFYWPHALAALSAGKARGNDGLRLERKVLRWMRRQNSTSVSLTDIRRDALGQAHNAEQVEALLDRLEAAGWLRQQMERTGGRPKKSWLINPQLHQKLQSAGFAARHPVAGIAGSAESSLVPPPSGLPAVSAVSTAMTEDADERREREAIAEFDGGLNRLGAKLLADTERGLPPDLSRLDQEKHIDLVARTLDNGQRHNPTASS